MPWFIPSMQTILALVPYIVPSRLYPWLRTLVIQSLKVGPLPKHVAFIMDGNRRFSREHGVEVSEGHMQGFKALTRVLELLLRLEIPNVTVYAFAIENFNRPHHEVEALMELARVKLVELCEKGQLLDRYGVRVFVIGRKELLPPDVRRACEKIESLTSKNTRGCLNVAFPYSSQEEMSTAIFRSIQQTLDSKLPESNITPELIESNLYTCHSPPLDIVIRTSGVCRLSDFLLWQTTGSVASSTNDKGRRVCLGEERRRSGGAAIHFIDRFWPDIGVLDILPILLGWQSEAIVDAIGDKLLVGKDKFTFKVLQ